MCYASPFMTFDTVKIKLIECLTSQSQPLINEINVLLHSLDFDYYEKYNQNNIAALKFEYEFDSFDIVVYPLDKSYEVAGDIKVLLAVRPHDSLFPNNIEEGFLQTLT